MSQLLFEVFNIAGLFIQDAAVLSLFSVGRLTGCAVDLGHGKTTVAPVTEGQVQAQSTRRLEIAGMHTTRYLQEQLGEMWCDRSG